jgi:flagellar FliL protein
MAKKPKNSDAETEAPKDGEAAEGDAKSGGKKGLLGNKLVLAGVGVVVLGLLGGGGWFFFLKKPKVDAAEQAAKPPPRTTGFVDMKEMLVNISGGQPGERQTIIKVKVALEIADAKMAPDIQPLLPRVEDMFQVYLRELRPADLEGSAGTFRLKEELLRRVNAAVHPAKVDAVLFKELLVQ